MHFIDTLACAKMHVHVLCSTMQASNTVDLEIFVVKIFS